MDNSKFIKDVLDQCHNFENIINKDLLVTFAKLHGVSPENSLLKTKQEVIASTSCFFTRKKYALYIINKEGNEKSEYNFTGISIRRSNYPKYTKDNVLKLLDILLKSEDLLDALRKANEFTKNIELEVKDLCKEGSKLIAGSVKYSKKMEEYKQIPYQVKAMELWNDLEYSYFSNGTKGFLYRISGIDLNLAPERVLNKLKELSVKSTSIVLPFEEEKLPEYYIVDIKKQTDFVWNDRVKEIMEAVRYDNKEDETIKNEMEFMFDD